MIPAVKDCRWRNGDAILYVRDPNFGFALRNAAMTDVEIYSSMFCGYCNRAKQLLSNKGVAFTEFEVSMDAGKRQEMMERCGGRSTVPQIFIGGRHVGGWDDLAGLERSGELDGLLGLAS